MSNWQEFSAKTVDEALTEALIKLETTSDQIEYEVLEKESTGLLGLFSKPARIRVCKKEDVQDIVKDFLKRLFENMHLNVEVDMKYDEEEKVIYIDLKGDEMGLLIGKRGRLWILFSILLLWLLIKIVKNILRLRWIQRITVSVVKLQSRTLQKILRLRLRRQDVRLLWSQ